MASLRDQRQKAIDIKVFHLSRYKALLPIPFASFTVISFDFESATAIMPSVAGNFTAVTHREPYTAISPSRPELSQKGKVVLVTGSSGGIGFAIARAFGKASAAKVILTGRRQDPLDKAVAALSKESPKTTFIARLNDASDTSNVVDLWTQFDAEGLVVDVLVLNVARVHNAGSILEIGYKEVLADLATNANSIAAFVHLFYHQNKRDASKKLVRIWARRRYLRTV